MCQMKTHVRYEIKFYIQDWYLMGFKKSLSDLKTDFNSDWDGSNFLKIIDILVIVVC